MRRRRVAAWSLSLPLMIAGSQIAHLLAYQLVYPSSHVRLVALLSTGHGYMQSAHGYLPLVLGVTGAIDLIAAGWVLAGSVRRSLQRPVPAAAFALMPLVCFTLQEFLERWFSGARLPWWTFLQSTFQVGLLLQFPFALLAFLAARVLLRSASAAGRRLRPTVPRPASYATAIGWLRPRLGSAHTHQPARANPGRGPPRWLAAAAAS